MRFQIETLAIGDELLTGRIADTNSAYVASELFREGFRLERVSVVPDEIPAIQSAMREAAARSRILLCFGGLGPTSDDKTAQCVAELLGCPLISHAPSEQRLRVFMEKRGRPITTQNLKQVIVPACSEPILNPEGLAPAFRVEYSGARFYFMPGVPREMKAIFTQSILPEILAEAGQSERIRSHTWKLIDIPESEVQRRMDPIEAALPAKGWLGYRTRFPENHLTLYLRQAPGADNASFLRFQERIRAILSPWSYTEEDKELEELVLEKLAQRRWKVALAESCTGGMTAQRLSRIPGASDFLWGGYTTYRVEAKKRMLGVEVANAEAAVSADCSRALALAARAASGCEVAAAITGYLGPSGGTPTDPLGTLYLCVAGETLLEKRIVQLPRERKEGQWGASTHLLHLLKVYL